MQLRRLLGTSLAVASAVGAVAVATAAPAAAATPTQSTIDGKQAYEMGCRADSKVIYHVLIKNSAGTAQGYVDLVASTYCHSAWVHVHGTRVVQNQTYVPHGTVHRNSDGREYRCTGGEGTQDCYTPMVWDKGVTSYGIGEIDPNGATNTTYKARTASY